MKRLSVLFGLAVMVVFIPAPPGSAVLLGAGERSSRVGSTPVSDFNNDGFEDLAVGVFAESVNGEIGAGAVNVIYGSAEGLSDAGNQFWSQDSPTILGVAEMDDRFGEALVAGDFDGDGYADAAIAAQGEDFRGKKDAGVVHVMRGGAGGLTAEGNQLWSQDSTGVADVAEDGDSFGLSLAAGDFDGDAFADLAIGVHSEDVDDQFELGAVNVLYGSPGGLSAEGDQIWHQDSPGIEDEAEPNDWFGLGLAAGDFDGDAFADLAIGVPLENTGNTTDHGAVNVIYGSTVGLTAEGNQYWTQRSPGILDDPEQSEEFGRQLSAGDFDGDGTDDLAIAVSKESLGGMGAGAAAVIYGSPTGLTDAGNQLWAQATPGVEGTPEGSEAFGWALVAGDFNGDGLHDMAVSSPEDTEALPRVTTGSVNVIYGSPTGLAVAGNQLWTQDSAGILDEADPADGLGWALTSGDYDGDGLAEMSAGLRREYFGDVEAAGAVMVIYGAPGGLSAEGNQLWSQGSPGILDDPELSDFFGTSLG